MESSCAHINLPAVLPEVGAYVINYQAFPLLTQREKSLLSVDDPWFTCRQNKSHKKQFNWLFLISTKNKILKSTYILNSDQNRYSINITKARNKYFNFTGKPIVRTQEKYRPVQWHTVRARCAEHTEQMHTQGSTGDRKEGKAERRRQKAKGHRHTQSAGQWHYTGGDFRNANSGRLWQLSLTSDFFWKWSTDIHRSSTAFLWIGTFSFFFF